MQGIVKRLLVMVGALMQLALAQTNSIPNPILWADVPDISIVRVDAKYYMVSTTMHMNPGAPIMESTDLVNWKIINYVHTTLASNDLINLIGGQNDYGHGSWAASIRYKSGTFYVLIPGKSSGFTHLYSTTDIHNGPWKEVKLPFWHDPSLHLEEDGKAYVVYGSGDIRIIELESDLTKVKSGGVDKVLIANATAVAGTGGLGSEGAHIEKINGYYYVFTISWPPGNMRTETVHRSQTLLGTYDGRIAFQDKGVAQGSVIQASDGTWYGYLFQDAGAVGRCPWLVPLKWENDWPVFGTNGKAPTTLSMNASLPVDGFGIVASDDFSASKLKLEWQWNHNPVQTAWSLSSRAGFMRLTTTRTDTDFLQARNTLTQRAYGPKSSAQIALETSGMKDGDFAGLGGLQKQYGLVGVKVNGASKTIVMVNGAGASPVEVASVALSQNKIYLRVDMDFTSRTDKATFFYSLDGNSWALIGNAVPMAYTIPHFMGYRFALFHYATKSAGGYADFDFFKIGKAYNSLIPIAAVIASSSSVQSSSSAQVSSSSNVPQAAYKGVFAIPGTVQAENYDVGGQNVSYFDSKSGNDGATYRTDDVDVVADGSDLFVGYTLGGEWLEYSVNVEKDGPYIFKARVASESATGVFSLLMDGVPIADSIPVPNTGLWTTFSEISGETGALTKGPHILRLNIDAAYFNVDWIRFDELTPSALRHNPSPLLLKKQPQYDLLGRFHSSVR